MLSLNFGTTFDDDTPLQIFARHNLSDGNLMGSGGLYQSLGEGPGGLLAAPAFGSGTEYTLEFTVSRTAADSTDISTRITGGGADWSFAVTDATYAYHRFDAFALRPNSLETTAESFTFSRFRVEVIAAPAGPPLFTAVARLGDGRVQLGFTGASGDFRLWAAQDPALTPITSAWTQLTNGTFDGSAVVYVDQQAVPPTQRFYILSTP
jgi:hypothetical protein